MIQAPRLQLWHAPLYPDLRTALVENLDAGAITSPLRTLWVPTHALGEELRRTHARRHGATFAVRIVTSVELALAVAWSERDPDRRRLGSEARAWLLRQLELRRNRGPTCFDAALGGRGFRTALGRSFETLARAGLASAAEVEKSLLRYGLDMPLPARHLLELYLAYRRSFEATHDDAAALMARAAATPPGRSPAWLGSRLWVFGFSAMDGLETRLLTSLGRDPGIAITVCVPQVEPEEPGWRAQLEAAGFVPVAVAGTNDAGGTGALRAHDVRLLAAPSAESEADEIARALLAAAAHGTSFGDMAVVVRHDARLALLHATFERRGIPTALHPGRSLSTTRCGRALVAFLDLLLSGLEPEPVFAFLATAPLAPGWGGFETDPVPSAWERAGRDAFLGRGLEDWTAKLERLAAELRQQAERREAQGDPALQSRASAQAAEELLRLATALAAELGRFPSRAGWGDYIAATDALLASAFAPGDERDAVRRALERLRALTGLGATNVSRPEFRDALRGLLAEAILPANQDAAAVQLGTAAALQGMEFELVCLAGVQEGEWPATPGEDPLLLAHERAAVAACLAEPHALDTAARGLRRDRRWFQHACAAARHRLVLSWARFDATTGAACLPAASLLEFASRREGREVDYAALESLPWVERIPLHRRSLPEAAPILGLDEIDTMHLLGLDPAVGRRYVLGLGECARRGLGLDRLRNRAGRFTSVDGMLAGRAAAVLQQRYAAATFSPTQLATYATCPFRYFLRQVLRLEPLERQDRREVSDLVVGRLVHRILEVFYRDLPAAGSGLEAFSDADLAARLQHVQAKVLDEVESRGQTGARLLWEIRKQRLGEDLRQFLRAERDRAGDGWRPAEFEWRFGPGTECVPGFGSAPATRVRLRGIVDRVDRHPQRGGVRVVDYKSGRLLPTAHAPQAVQLAVYLLAATGGDTARLEASEAHFAYVTRRGGFALQRLSGAVLRRRGAELERFVLEVAAGVRRGDFFPRPGPDRQHCASCDFEAVCEVRVAHQATLKAPAGQTAFVEALPDFATALEGAPERDVVAEGEA